MGLRSTRCALAALAAIWGLSVAGSAAAREEINWFMRVEDARTAAAKSGKPVYLYIFSPPQKACERMRAQTLMNPQVIAYLNKHFECCAVDSTDEANAAWVDRYAWGLAEGVIQDPTYDREYTARAGSMPAHVVIDSKGDPYFTFWGAIPPAGFLLKLDLVREVVRTKTAVEKNPQDARALADLGHALLELEDLANARPRLERARDLDPDNAVGALESATLDLLVLAIPDQPAPTAKAIADFIRKYPRSGRLLEARYWYAVALYAQQTPAGSKQALEALAPFKGLDPNSAEYKSRWAVLASKLEEYIRIDLGLEARPQSTREPVVHR